MRHHARVNLYSRTVRDPTSAPTAAPVARSRGKTLFSFNCTRIMQSYELLLVFSPPPLIPSKARAGWWEKEYC